VNARLIPLLIAYDEDLPTGAPATPADAAAGVEQALLRTTRTALEGLDRPAPPADAVAAVMAAAREASEASGLAAVRSVMAGGAPSESVEAALLETTWQAVRRTPRAAPPAALLAALEAAAKDAAAASELAPLRDVLAGRPADGAEAALLRTTLAAVGRLPRHAPPSDITESLVAAAGRAARASELEPLRTAMGARAGASGGAEGALLGTTWQAVERLPREAPPIAAVQAVLAAAHDAIPAPIRRANRAADRAEDRAPAASVRSYRAFVYLTATLALAGLVSVSLWVTRDGPRRTALTADGALDERASGPTTAAAPMDVPAPVTNEGDASAPLADLAAGARGTQFRARAPAATAVSQEVAAAFAPPPPPAAPPPPPAAQRAFPVEGAAGDELLRTEASVVGLAQANERADSPGAGLAGAPSVAPAWEAGADVRMLSLRLQSLQQQAAGVSWDDPPTPLGAAETGAAVPEGFDPVGTTRRPARVQVRVLPTD
jgi:hypothetical protein